MVTAIPTAGHRGGGPCHDNGPRRRAPRSGDQDQRGKDEQRGVPAAPTPAGHPREQVPDALASVDQVAHEAAGQERAQQHGRSHEPDLAQLQGLASKVAGHAHQQAAAPGDGCGPQRTNWVGWRVAAVTHESGWGCEIISRRDPGWRQCPNSAHASSRVPEACQLNRSGRVRYTRFCHDPRRLWPGSAWSDASVGCGRRAVTSERRR
jgi:hypothetical protein